METKRTWPINLLIFFYCFVFLQNLTLRSKAQVPVILEAFLLGTLIYLVVGFWRGSKAARWIAVAFHALFQVSETAAVYYFLRHGLPPQLTAEMPAAAPGSLNNIILAVFAIVTVINIGAIVYLIRHGEYFSASQAAATEEEPEA